MPNTTRSTTVFALTGIILLALGIRTGVAAIAPLAPVMDLDVAMEGLPLGIIGTIPAGVCIIIGAPCGACA